MLGQCQVGGHLLPTSENHICWATLMEGDVPASKNSWGCSWIRNTAAESCPQMEVAMMVCGKSLTKAHRSSHAWITSVRLHELHQGLLKDVSGTTRLGGGGGGEGSWGSWMMVACFSNSKLLHPTTAIAAHLSFRPQGSTADVLLPCRRLYSPVSNAPQCSSGTLLLYSCMSL